MTRILVPVAFLIVGFSLGVSAFKEGPYPNVTGGFGEQTCHLCHLDNPRQRARRRGRARRYSRRHSRPDRPIPSRSPSAAQGLRRGGFEIAARFAGGKQKGRQAGSWRLDDTRAQLIPGAVDKALTFVQHNQIGSRAATPGANTWTMEWTAPPAPAGVGAVQRRRERVEQRRLAARRLHLCEGGQERSREVGLRWALRSWELELGAGARRWELS